MRLVNPNIQPIRITVVKATSTGQLVDARLGTPEMPFYFSTALAAVHVTRGNFSSVNQGASLYCELTLELNHVDLETLHRIESAVNLGYEVLLSLPMIDLSFPVTLAELKCMMPRPGANLYTLSMYERPVQRGFWARLNKWLNFNKARSAVQTETLKKEDTGTEPGFTQKPIAFFGG